MVTATKVCFSVGGFFKLDFFLIQTFEFPLTNTPEEVFEKFPWRLHKLSKNVLRHRFPIVQSRSKFVFGLAQQIACFKKWQPKENDEYWNLFVLAFFYRLKFLQLQKSELSIRQKGLKFNSKKKLYHFSLSFTEQHLVCF